MTLSMQAACQIEIPLPNEQARIEAGPLASFGHILNSSNKHGTLKKYVECIEN